MSVRRLPAAVSLVLVTALWAGCIGGDDGEVRVPAPPLPGVDDANDTTLGPVAAPQWKVGQWWGHHTYWTADDRSGNHYNVVVVEAGPSGYVLASQHPDHATAEARSDVFDLGAFGADLATTRGGAPWKWYDWPLAHNKTWSQELVVGDVTHALELRATEATDLRTAQGERPGFRITGTNADGAVVLTYDYVLELGWFADLDLFDPADPSTPIFKVRSMGHGDNKTGEYYTVAIVPLEKTYAPTGVPDTDTFVVPEGTERLVGSIDVAITLGQATMTLRDPAGKAYEYSAEAPGGAKAFPIDMKRPPAGEWSVTFLALGQGGTATLDLEAVVQTAGTL